MANSKKPTHLRIKRDSVPLAGHLFNPGDVVEIADLDFDRPETLPAILELIATHQNTYPVLEAGVLLDNEFVLVPKPPTTYALEAETE